MSPTVKSLGIDQLSISDRMRLLEEIWESIESSPEPPATESAASEFPNGIWKRSTVDWRKTCRIVSREFLGMRPILAFSAG